MEFWRPFHFPKARRGDTIRLFSDAFPLDVAIVSDRNYRLFLSNSMGFQKFTLYVTGPIVLKTSVGKCWVIIRSNKDIGELTRVEHQTKVDRFTLQIHTPIQS